LSDRDYSPDEVIRRGEEIYRRDLRARVEAEHFGKFIVIDVNSGDYEIDADEIAATSRARIKHPDGSKTRCLLRIGYPAAHHIGGSMRIILVGRCGSSDP
jgi:hypothetical protein